jgi:DNA-binding NarL/FixJ family response regulator
VDARQAPFVGRSSELERLEASVDQARSAPRLAVIAGEAGVGKTRLLEECLASLTDQRVLRGWCLPFEAASMPYGPIVQALRSLTSSLESHALRAVLGSGRVELGRILPEIASSASGGPPAAAAEATPEAGAQARLFEQTLGLIERLSTRPPVVLAIEDVHWAEPGTRDMLRFLVRNLRSPVLVLLTVRSDDLREDDPVRPFLADLERLESAARIELARFSRSDVEALLLNLTGTPPSRATVDRIYGRSDGNAFFVEQLVAAGESDSGVPARLADTLRARLAEVSETSREVLRAAAAAARPVDDELLAEVTGLEPRAVEVALREAISAKLLVPAEESSGESGYRFRHALLREVAYAELLPAQRRRLHRAVATALQAQGTQGDRRVPTPAASELAFHWEAGAEWQAAIDAHLEAAEAAAGVYAWSAAVHHYARTIELLELDGTAIAHDGVDGPELLHRAADAAFLAADYPRAVEWGRAAIDAVAASEPHRAGRYHIRLRWYLWDSGDRDGAVASVQEALRLVPPDPPSAERAAALAQWSGALMHAGRAEEAAATARETIEVARAVGARGDEAEALAILGWIDVMVGRPDPGFAAMREAAAIAEEVGDVSGTALGHALIAHMHAFVDQPSAALAAALEGYEAIVRVGAERTYGPVLLGHAVKALIELGEWDEADRLVRVGFEQELVDRPAHLLRIQRGRLATLRGSWDAAARDLAAARAFEVASGGSEYGDDLLAAEAELAAWSGNVPAARAAFEAVGRRPPAPPGPPIAWIAAHAVRAEADDAEQARAQRAAIRQRVALERATDILARWPGPPGTPVRLLAEAEMQRLKGTPDPAAWRAVGAAFEAAGRPFHVAQAQYREAAALLASRADRASVKRLLLAAQETAQRLRAQSLGQEIARLARRARVALGPGPTIVQSPETGATLGPERLTTREAEVLRLLAGGWTNRQIADELFISPRTASVHVANIFGKLGANSRVEAAAIAHRLGLAHDPPPPPDTGREPSREGAAPAPG